MAIKPQEVIHWRPDQEGAIDQVREWVKSRGLTGDDVKLVRREALGRKMIMVETKRECVMKI